MSLVQGIEVTRHIRTSNQYVSGVEFFGEALNNETRLRPFVITLPESCRTPSVNSIVTVVKGNNPESTCVKNVTTHYSGAISYQYVEIERLYLFDILGGKSIHETGLGNDGIYYQYVVDEFPQIKYPIVIAMHTVPFEEQAFQ